MHTPLVESLPYRPDSAEVFGRLAAEPWAALLDSGTVNGAGGGRYDILAIAPRETLVTRGALTEWCRGGEVVLSGADPFDLLREALAARGPTRAGPTQPRLPFAGGALGWLGYDLARRIEPAALPAAPAGTLPQMALGIYDWALVVDHRRRETWLAGFGDAADPARRRLRDAALSPADRPLAPFRLTGRLTSSFDAAGYRERFERVRRYIRAGDCYQVNLARRWSAPVQGDPWAAYRWLRRRGPSPFGAYLNTPQATLLSLSPERFVSVRGERVQTCPIKGTIRRAADPGHDQALAEQLAASPKDRAENLMIVDLLRNDLGRSCATGSVRVPRLFEVQSFAGLHHLVSTVTGRLAAGADALTLLRGCFPGGSITGAPKIRAMQIIDELEGISRGVYCGSIGYLGFDGGMDTSIAIRTAVVAGGELCFWAGGGLVADSRCDAEWDEITLKARAFLALAERFGAAAGDGQLCGARVR